MQVYLHPFYDQFCESEAKRRIITQQRIDRPEEAERESFWDLKRRLSALVNHKSGLNWNYTHLYWTGKHAQ